MKKRNLFLSIFLVIALSACNLPSGNGDSGGGDSGGVDDLALTVTAQYLLLNQSSATPQFTPTPGPSSTPEFTPTPSVPQVTVSVNTNCRTGPSTQYDNIDSLLVGQTGTVVGKNSPTGYWIINRLNGSGTCWLFPQYATVSGNTANLPEYPVPPTPTPSKTPTPTATATLAPPVAVSNVAVAKICIPPVVFPFILYQYGGNLTWTDNSNNEDGFNIYFNGALFTNVGANVTAFALPVLPFVAAVPQKWGVESYNSAGKAATKDSTFTCP